MLNCCKMSEQNFTARRALQILQNLPPYCSNDSGPECETEALVNATVANVMVRESESSKSSDEEVHSRSERANPVVQGALFQGRNGLRWKMSSYLPPRANCIQTVFCDFILDLHCLQLAMLMGSPLHLFRILLDEPMCNI